MKEKNWLNFRCPPELRAKLERIAEKQNRSLSNLVVLLLEHAAARYKL